jgi:hypothetical protein
MTSNISPTFVPPLRTCYRPIPPRVWSRVQNTCSYVTSSTPLDPGYVKLPFSGKIVPFAELGRELAMLRKGNVLQYKANSSNITQTQRYSKIAKGQWTNRNITWATQNANGFSNPNTQSLLRVAGTPGNSIIDTICAGPNVPIDNTLPPIIGPTENTGDNLPPIIQPVNPGDNNIPIVPPIPPDFIPIFPDFGHLVCNTKHNPCNGETIFNKADIKCHPTTDSDVPGPIQDLCWNEGFPTWYPRQRYTMNTSTDGWPKNYKLFRAAIQAIPPVITHVEYTAPFLYFTWTEETCCLDISFYTFFENNVQIHSAKVTEKNTSFYFIPNLPSGSTYTFTMKANIQYEQGLIISDPSNVVEIII